MKLVHPNWEHSFNFDIHRTHCLIIENPITLREYITELQTQIAGEEGLFVLSNKNKDLKIPDNMSLLPDLLFFDISDRKLTTRIQSLLKTFSVSSDMYIKTAELISALIRYADSVVDNFDYPISYKEPDSAALIKFLGFDAKYEYDTQIEKLIEYFDLYHDICGVSIFVLLNPSSFFSNDEIKIMLEHCIHLDHMIISIENRETYSSKLYERKIIIDEDNCEIF